MTQAIQARRYMKTDKTRRALFLAALDQSFGNFSFACEQASKHITEATKNPPAYSTWRGLLDTDPSFRQAVSDVNVRVRDRVFGELMDRVMNGTTRNLYQGGKQVFNKDGTPARITEKETKWLVRVLERFDPSWRQSSTVEHTHNVHDTAATIKFEVVDMEQLPQEKHDQLLGLLSDIQRIRRAAAGEGELIEHQTVAMIDISPPDETDEDIEAKAFVKETA